jgi:beta-lactamase class A
MAGVSERDRVSVSLVECTPRGGRYAGYQDERLRYPASLAKLFVAAELSQQLFTGEVRLDQTVEVVAHNERPLDLDGFKDRRREVKAGEKRMVEELYDLCITRSCNTSANVLIDLLTRERINAFVQECGWHGSEVTRKFLPRGIEDEKYREAPMTQSCTRHLAELLYLLARDELKCWQTLLWLKHYMGQQLDKTKLAAVLPPGVKYLHKTGWCGEEGDSEIIWTTADCGIVKTGKKTLVVACIVNLYGEAGREVIHEVGRELRQFM